MLYLSLSTILSFHHGAVLVAGQRDKNKISYYKHYIIIILFLVAGQRDKNEISYYKYYIIKILFLVAGQRDQLKGAHRKTLDDVV